MKDKVLKLISTVAWVVLIISIMSLDSKDITIPLISGSVSLIWILLIMIANSDDLDDGGWRE